MNDGAHGIIESLFLLKEKHRNLKTLLSIGGYGEPTSAAFTALASSSKTRAHFVEDAIAKIKEYGFDGIDIDWEYPSSSTDGVNFVKLLAELRAAMDAYSSRSANNYHFEITVAVSGSAWGYRNLDFSGMDKYLDAWHLMTYDFKGGWETGADATAGHHANLYHSKTPGASALAANDSVETYLQHHIPSKKIVLGLPLYAHAYFGTEGLGMPYSRTEAEGFPYKEMATSGLEYNYDSEAAAAYTYNAETKTLMSFDSPESVKAKMEFLKKKRLGGAMWWEISNDKIGDDSLVSTVASELAGGWEVKENLLYYPESTITKIREGGC
jgi:chitinase